MTAKAPKGYTIIQYLGKGKSGYSYLVEKDNKQYVYKQIHHEEVTNYSFSNKLEHELIAYQQLLKTNITIPKLISVNTKEEYLIKEYIKGDTLLSDVAKGNIPQHLYMTFVSTALALEEEGINIDYFPNNFIIHDDKIVYIDYEVNEYSDEWNFLNWGLYMWFNVEGCALYAHSDNDASLLVNEQGNSKAKNRSVEASLFIDKIKRLDLVSLYHTCKTIFNVPLSDLMISSVSGGLAAESYKIQTNKHNFFLKVYAPHTPKEDIQEEIDAYKEHYPFQATLYHYQITRKNTTSFLLFEFIKGKQVMRIYEDSENKQAIIQTFTESMTMYHEVKTNTNTQEFINEELSIIRRLNKKFKNNTISQVVDYLSKHIASITQYPLVKIHGDYHPWNTIINDGKLIIIDWKQRFGDVRYDVAWTYELLLRSNYKDFADGFLSLYQQANPKIAKDFAFFTVLANTRWLLNVLTDIDKVEESFKALIYSMLPTLIARVEAITSIKIKGL